MKNRKADVERMVFIAMVAIICIVVFLVAFQIIRTVLFAGTIGAN